MVRCLLLCLALALSGCAADGTFTSSAVGAGQVAGPDWKRVVIQPNGWGATPEAARKDLDRLMDLYAKLPGFQRDDYIAIVPIAKGVYQSDGRCSYLAPPARTATDARPGLRVIPD